MGGSSKSSTSSVTENISNHHQHHTTNNTALTGEGVIWGSDNTIVTYSSDAEVLKSLGAGAFGAVTDMSRSVENMHSTSAGLVEALGREALSSSEYTTAKALQTAEAATKASMGFVNQFTERAQLGAAAGQNEALKWVALASVAVVGVLLLKGKR